MTNYDLIRRDGTERFQLSGRLHIYIYSLYEKPSKG